MKAMLRPNRKAAVQFVTVLAAAYALKYFYSTASANELRWILWPTTRLTELVTGTTFTFEGYAGYLSSDRTFLIASACAGVNFLIAAFVLLSLRQLWNKRESGTRWYFFPFAIAVSYALTIVANTVRISSALWLNKERQGFAGLDHDEVHRLDGIFIYFGFLLLLFVAYEKLSSENKAVRLRQYLFPLAIYYAMTLAVPILNGALNQGMDFWRHAAFVLAAPLVLVMCVAVPAQLISRYSKKKDVAAFAPLLPADLSADEIRARANVRDAAAFSHRTIWLKHTSVVDDP
jgi:exosortase K